MLMVGFSYFLFLFIDIRMHVKKAKKAVKDKEARMKMFEEQLARTEARNHCHSLQNAIINSCKCPTGSSAKLIRVHANSEQQQHQLADSSAALIDNAHPASFP